MITITEEEKYMSLAIDLSLKGLGNTSPNPIVGCVVVKDGVVVGRGYHQYAGGPHAEVIALRQAGKMAEGADLYVTLEPCNIYGRTPPCTEVIIKSGVKRVYIAVVDPNPHVSGNGIRILENAGIKTITGVLEKKAAFENRFYLTYRKYNRPYVTLKIASTIDGKIADKNGNSKWISSEESRSYVQLLRRIYDAVLVGAGTIRKDNPRLTYRGEENKVLPLKRIILFGSSEIPTDARIFKETEYSPLIIILPEGKQIPSSPKDKLKNIHFIHLKKNGDRIKIETLLKKLAEQEILSVLVEGGSKVFSQFLESGLYDEIYWFMTPKLLGDGVFAFEFQRASEIDKAPQLNLYSIERFSDDVLLRFFNKEVSWF